MKIFLSFLIVTIVSLNLYAQQPRVVNISQNSGVAGRAIEISGSGFGSNQANLRVWFGAAKAEILSVTENIIEVKIPEGATTSSIAVTNLATGLTGFSSEKFHLIFPGDVNATVTAPDRYTFPSTKELFDIVIADLDGDDKNDVVATEIDDAATQIIIYRNDAVTNTISFVTSSLSITKPTVNLSAGDIDGDGKLDLVLSRGGNTRNQIYALLNTSTVGNISFAVAKSYYLATGSNAHQVMVRDMDLDGKSEVIVTNTSGSEISIFKNNSVPGNINLSFTPTTLSIDSAPSTNGLAIDDFDLDGKPDIAITTFLDNDIFIVPNTSVSGTLQFGSIITVSASGNINNIAAGDVNDDGKIDLVVSKPIQNEIAVLLNNSSGSISFSSPQTFSAASGSWDVALVDYIGNRKLDILVTSPSGAVFSFFKNTSSSGTLSLTKTDISQTYRTRNIFAGDISNDGKSDFVMSAKDATGTSFLMLAIRNSTCIEPIILGDPSITICPAQIHTFRAAPNRGAIFIWKKDGVEVKNSPDPFYATAAPGTYTLTTESEGGSCSIESNPVTLSLIAGTVPGTPVATNNGPTCIGTDVELYATTITGATYEWIGPNGFTSTDQNPIITNSRPEDAGFYYVRAISGDCESDATRTLVEAISPPDFTIIATGPTRFCDGDFVTLSVSSVTGYNYQWLLDDVDIVGATASSYTATTAGDYKAHIVGTTTNCDLFSNTETVSVFPAPVAAFTASGNTCAFETISFEDNSVIETDQTALYAWDFDDGSAINNTQNPTHSFAAIGAYNVSLTVSYQGQSCSDTVVQIINIEEPTPFIINITGDVPFCEGDSVLLEVPGTYSQYVWSNGSTTSSIYALNSGTYTATAYNSSGCPYTTSTDITTLSGPDITVTADESTIFPGSSAQLNASGADSYSWSPSESLNDPSIANPVATPTVTTIYQVVGKSGDGCDGFGEITITVQDTGDELPVIAPKMFSPNNDGIDDTWVIENMLNFPDCTLKVFTRNGATVYETQPYNNNWDGTSDTGTKLNEGAYYYIITCDDSKVKSGSVSIID